MQVRLLSFLSLRQAQHITTFVQNWSHTTKVKLSWCSGEVNLPHIADLPVLTPNPLWLPPAASLSSPSSSLFTASQISSPCSSVQTPSLYPPLSTVQSLEGSFESTSCYWSTPPGGVASPYTQLNSLFSISPVKMDFLGWGGKEGECILYLRKMSFSPFYYNYRNKGNLVVRRMCFGVRQTWVQICALHLSDFGKITYYP